MAQNKASIVWISNSCWERSRGVAVTSVLLLCALLLSFLPSVSISSEVAESPLEKARTKFYAGELPLAKELFLSLTPQYDADANYYLALIHKGLPEADFDVVIKYLTRSAVDGNSLAMWQLGQAYENGEGVPEDPMLAMDWYRKAKSAEQTSSYSVTYYSDNGGGLTETPGSEMYASVKVRAEGGGVEAQYKLASMYDAGGVLGVDGEKAFYWYQHAAQNGHSYSQYVLGYMHCRGIGIESDVDLANYWLIESGRPARCGQH